MSSESGRSGARLARWVLAACVAAPSLFGQDDGASADPDAPTRWEIPRALTDQERAGFTSIERWRLPELVLPEGVTRTPERFSVSTQPLVFLDMPEMEGLLPAPTETFAELWTTERDGEQPRRGGLMLLRYAGGVPDEVAQFLPGYLYGSSDGGPNAEHPEDLVLNGEFVLILSFAVDDPTGDWLRARILEHTGVRIPRTWAEYHPQILELLQYYLQGDRIAGQTVFYSYQDVLQENSMAQFWAAEFARWDADWERADVHYAWVAYLDGEGIDAFPDDPSLRWSLADGYGITLLALDKDSEALPWLRRAREIAVAEAQPELAAKSGYNLACVMARLGAPQRAVETLQSCIEVDASIRDKARADPDFDSLRERDDFRALLEG